MRGGAGVGQFGDLSHCFIQRGLSGCLQKENKGDRTRPVSFGLENRRDPYFLRSKNACDKGENAGTVLYFEADIETPNGFTFCEEF